MTKKATALLAVLFMCTLPGARAQDEPAESRLKIAFIAKSYANPVFVAAHRGAQDAAKEYSTEKGIPVEVLVLTPTGENPAQQAERPEQERLPCPRLTGNHHEAWSRFEVCVRYQPKVLDRQLIKHQPNSLSHRRSACSNSETWKQR